MLGKGTTKKKLKKHSDKTKVRQKSDWSRKSFPVPIYWEFSINSNPLLTKLFFSLPIHEYLAAQVNTDKPKTPKIPQPITVAIPPVEIKRVEANITPNPRPQANTLAKTLTFVASPLGTDMINGPINKPITNPIKGSSIITLKKSK